MNSKEVLRIESLIIKSKNKSDSSIIISPLNKESPFKLFNNLSYSNNGNPLTKEVIIPKSSFQLNDKNLEEFLKIDFNFKANEPNVLKLKAKAVLKKKNKPTELLSKEKTCNFRNI